MSDLRNVGIIPLLSGDHGSLAPGFNHCMNLPHQQRRQSVAQRVWLSYTDLPSTTTQTRLPTCNTETELIVSASVRSRGRTARR
jgi:hypothetical protein